MSKIEKYIQKKVSFDDEEVHRHKTYVNNSFEKMLQKSKVELKEVPKEAPILEQIVASALLGAAQNEDTELKKIGLSAMFKFAELATKPKK